MCLLVIHRETTCIRPRAVGDLEGMEATVEGRPFHTLDVLTADINTNIWGEKVPTNYPARPIHKLTMVTMVAVGIQYKVKMFLLELGFDGY